MTKSPIGDENKSYTICSTMFYCINDKIPDRGRKPLFLFTSVIITDGINDKIPDRGRKPVQKK